MNKENDLILILKERLARGEITKAEYIELEGQILARPEASDQETGGFDARATFQGIGIGIILKGRYEILAELGRGGMGVVYKAKDRELETEVAVKVLPDELVRDARAVRNLMEEAKISMRLTHPHIMRLHTFESDERRKFLVMEYIEGETLESRLTKTGRLPESDLIPLASQICEGLAYAHKQKVIHRDIKLSNIMISSLGEAKIMDFGIARIMKDSMTALTGRLTTGTLIYMSPEQIEGRDVDGRSDIYSLGVLMYELASGNPPFYQGNITHQHLKVEPKPIGGISARLNEIILKCLAKEKEKRYSSAAELMAVLEGKADAEEKRRNIQTLRGEADQHCREGFTDLALRSLKKILQIDPNYSAALNRIRELEAEIRSVEEKKREDLRREKERKAAEERAAKQRAEELRKREEEARAVASFHFEESRKNNRKGILWGILGIAAVIILVIVLKPRGRSENQTSPPQLVQEIVNPDLQDYQNAKRQNTQTAFERYLSIHPNGKYVDEAKSFIGNFKAQVLLKASKSSPIAPSAGPSKPVQEAVDPDLQDYQTAKRQNNQAAFERYLSNHPNGKYADEARSFIGNFKAQASLNAPKPTPSVPSAERPVQELKLTAENQAVRNIQVIEPEMVYITGGTFQMGSNSSGADDDEKPIHSVTVSDFWIGKYEVTQAEWTSVMGKNLSNSIGDRLPAEKVSWVDIQEYIRKLNSAKGKNYRLPTEAEWEYACRAGTRGDRYGDLDSIAWYFGNSGSKTHPVGEKSANGFGLYDMLGNVWEWCADWYNSEYYKGSPSNNPKGLNSGDGRVVRGGAFNNVAMGARATNRDIIDPSSRLNVLGFRLARD